MPLRNRKEEEVSQLKGVTLLESVDPSKLKLGMFERLSNMTFSGIGSIKRKRGVAALDGVAEPELTLNFQDNFVRDDCDVITFLSDDCAVCLSITETGSVIATSAVATDPCFCFFGGQLCFNRLISIELEYVADTAGNGISGVTLAVPPTATALLFSGYGLVYTPGTLTLAKWTDATLATIETTLDTAALTLNPGDIIKLTYDTITGELIGYVNDVGQVTATDIDLQDVNNQGVGLIVVGNTGADDRAEWTNIFAECIDALPPPACSFVEDGFIIGRSARLCIDADQTDSGVVAAGTAEAINDDSCCETITEEFLVDFVATFPPSDLTPCGTGAPSHVLQTLPDLAAYTVSTAGFGWNDFVVNAVINDTQPDDSLVGLIVIDPISTPSETYAIGMIINRDLDELILVTWNGTALCDGGVVQDSVAYIPVIGDELQMHLQFDPFDSSFLFVVDCLVNGGATASIPTFDLNSIVGFTDPTIYTQGGIVMLPGSGTFTFSDVEIQLGFTTP